MSVKVVIEITDRPNGSWLASDGSFDGTGDTPPTALLSLIGAWAAAFDKIDVEDVHETKHREADHDSD